MLQTADEYESNTYKERLKDALVYSPAFSFSQEICYNHSPSAEAYCFWYIMQVVNQLGRNLIFFSCLV